jgi:hypothetical protein
MLFTAPGTDNDFTGNFRARGVTSVGVDLITKDAAFPVGGRYLTLVLTNDQGTPDDYEDDLLVWFVGDKQIPAAGEPGDGGTPPGWAGFDFDVAAADTTLPEGWETWAPEPMDPDDIWNAVVTDVAFVEFWYGEPGVIYPFNSWHVGADNVRISSAAEPPILGDLNGDGVVNHLDLRILVRSFGPCDGCPADLNGDGIVNMQDLWMLLALWDSRGPASAPGPSMGGVNSP